jgi:YD repeat-containing protein
MGVYRSGGDGGGCPNPKCCGGAGPGGGSGGPPGPGGAPPGPPGAGSGDGIIGSGGDGTTYARALLVDSISSDFTTSGCLYLPLKAGGNLRVGWSRFSGGMPAMMAYQDTWTPAGIAAVFSFLPIVNIFQTVANGRRRMSDTGSLNYSASDAPDNELAYAAIRTTTYWTEYDQRGHVYFEYFAGSSLATSDAMFGRLNRRYDTAGNQVLYSYGANASGQMLLRNITGLGGSVVPYFEYANETIDATHFAPITKMYLLDTMDATQSRTVYFVYDDSFSYPYLTKVVQPSGCVKGFYPYLPFDSYGTYHIGWEQDAEGYTTYFNYASNTLTRMVEPEGRLAYYNYSAALTSRADLNRAPRYLAYQTNASGNMPLIVRDQNPLGYTTYSVYDASVTRISQRVQPNGSLERFGMLGGSSGNRYAMAVHNWNYSGASIYYEYDTNTYNLNKFLGPRHVSGVFPVVTYYAYDSQQKFSRFVNALGQATVVGRDQQGNVTSALDGRGYATYFNYSSQTGFLTSYVDATGGSAYFSYNSFGDTTGVISPRWQDEGGFPLFATYYVYDQRSRPLRTIDPFGNVTYFDWTARGDLLDKIDARGTEVTFAYNGLRLPTKQTWFDASGNILSQTLQGYDIYKNLVRVLDPRGFPAYFAYDQIDRKTADCDALGQATYYFYDSVNNLTQLLDARGNTTYFAYDPMSRNTAQWDALGNCSYYYYDLADNKTQDINPRGAVTYFFFDALDRRSVRRDALGNASYFFYDAGGDRTQVRDARGNTTYFFFDGLRRRNALQDALGNYTYFGFDRSGNLIKSTDARGGVSQSFYDSLGRAIISLDAVSSATYYFYDATGNKTCERDARGNAVYFQYDGLARLIERDDPQGGMKDLTYDPVGNLVQSFEATALEQGGYGAQPYGTSGYSGTTDAESQLFYDQINRLQSSVDPVGNATYFFYDAVSNLTDVRDARSNTTYFFYDAVSRVSSTRDAVGDLTYYFYDQVGNRTVLLNANAHSIYFGYDSINRLTQIQDALGGTTSCEFDPMSNVTKVLDPDNHAVLTAYDALNRPSAVRMPDSGSAYFFYDAVSNRTMEVDPRGNTTYYGYDLRNRATRIQDALARTLYFEYDAVSNLSKYMDAEGATSAHTYDAVNRRTKTTYAPAGSVVSASLATSPYYVYDLAGNITQIGDLWGLHQFVYDMTFRPTLHQYPNGSKVYFEYDSVSNLTARIYPGSAGKAQAVYDQANRQILVKSPSGATAYFKYDAAANLTQRFLGNSAKQDMTYDAAERVSRWRNTKKNGASLTYFDYTRDAKGLVTKAVREANYTTYYTYDANDRLASEIWAKTGATPSEVYGYRYAYDLGGNRTISRINASDTYYFYDLANQLKVKGTTSAFASPSYYIYDKNGSLTNLVEPTGATYFAYNAAGLVARIRWRDASATYFFYDGNLQRYSMNAFGTVTYFLWDGPNLLQELKADGTTKEEHTNALTPVAGIGQLVETNRPGQTQAKIYPIMDPRGTITKWIQSDGTTVFASREYEAFGNLIPNSTTGTWPGRFGYQGQAWMEIFSGNGSQRLLLSPTRIYDPVTGRFLQNDPLKRGDPLLVNGVSSLFAGAGYCDRTPQEANLTVLGCNGSVLDNPSLIQPKCGSNAKTPELVARRNRALIEMMRKGRGQSTRSKCRRCQQSGSSLHCEAQFQRIIAGYCGSASPLGSFQQTYVYLDGQPMTLVDPSGLYLDSVSASQARLLAQGLAFIVIAGTTYVTLAPALAGGGAIPCPNPNTVTDFIMALMGIAAAISIKCTLLRGPLGTQWDTEGGGLICNYDCGGYGQRSYSPMLIGDWGECPDTKDFEFD